jgi:hypothetical protein
MAVAGSSAAKCRPSTFLYVRSICVRTLTPTCFTLSRSRDNTPPFVFDLLGTLPFLVHDLIPSFHGLALFANNTQSALPSSRSSQTATALTPFCRELSTPHGELLLAPSCNSLVSVTYKLPPRKSFATRTKMIGEGEGVIFPWARRLPCNSRHPSQQPISTSATIFVLPYLPWPTAR